MHMIRAILPIAIVAASVSAQRPARSPSILDVKEKTVRIRLMDALSALPISNNDVRVYSDNGIRCSMPPCPTNGMEWKGRTDAGGYLVVPRAMLQAATSITTRAHEGDLIRDAEKDVAEGWVADLVPRHLYGGDHLPPLPVKLVAAGSRKSIANAPVRIEFRTPSGKLNHVTLTTNKLGYVFVPYEAVAFTDRTFWLIAPGYQRTRIQVSAVERTAVLKPR